MDLKSIITVLVLWCIAIAAALLLFVYPRYRRKRIDSAPFPAPWLQILRRSLPIYKTMWPDQQKELRQLIKRFVEQKEFVGCAGQHIDDEVRITIAAHACLLLLNRPSHEYQGLKSILVYPSTFKVKHDKHDEFGLVTKGEHFLIGESWSTGKVILAWDSVQRSVHNFADGHNVVLHEFAHQLDHESGVTNGAPLLYNKGAYGDWARIFSEEFVHLQHASAARQQTLIDAYGASNPAEFFAVVTETFYERPHELAQRHAELFDELKSYYRVDPREWQSATKATEHTHATR